METKVTVNGSVTLIEIQKDGKAVNAQNPVSHEELADMLQSLEVSGGLSLSRSSGRPRLYPEGLEMTSLQVPKTLKNQVQAICIKLAWGRNKEAKKLIDE